MTQQTQNNHPGERRPILPVERRLPLPDPNATVLLRLATDPFAAGGSKEPIAWVQSQSHPLVPEAKVVRMYLREDGGVDVYWSDGQMFLRTYIPERAIRFFDEVMGEDTFVAFIEQAEAEPEEEEEEEPEPEPAPTPTPNPGNAGEPAATT
jgi:hypothetical protein